MGSSRDNTEPSLAASRRLAYVLRHQPHSIGIRLDAEGWVLVDELLAALAAAGHPLERDQLDELVEPAEGRRRYSYDKARTRVRAVQGHSLEVDLALEAVTPPTVLFHGTTSGAVAQILAEGLRPMSRQYVHLSATLNQAEVVGSRRAGPLVVFEVAAAEMHRAGYELYLAENGVWLTAAVPPQYLSARP